MERSAVQEIGNIVTSGSIDGWANLLNTTIDIGTPTFTDGPSTRIIEQIGGRPDEESVFALDLGTTTGDANVDLTVYTFPQVQELVQFVQNIDLGTDVQADSVADESTTSN